MEKRIEVLLVPNFANYRRIILYLIVHQMYLFGMCVAVMVGSIFAYLFNNLNLIQLIFVEAMFLTIILYKVLQPLHTYKKQERNGELITTRFVFTEQCIYINQIGKGTDINAEVHWNENCRIVETNKDFIFFENQKCHFYFAKNDVSSEDLLNLKELFREKLGNRFNSKK